MTNRTVTNPWSPSLRVTNPPPITPTPRSRPLEERLPKGGYHTRPGALPMLERGGVSRRLICGISHTSHVSQASHDDQLGGISAIGRCTVDRYSGTSFMRLIRLWRLGCCGVQGLGYLKTLNPKGCLKALNPKPRSRGTQRASVAICDESTGVLRSGSCPFEALTC